ncbi:MAG: tetratricopeptide repeat protein [Chamaesiphon sp.]
MDKMLPVVYLSFLLALLIAASWVIFRQILKSRKTETTLARLENSLKEQQGTVQEYYELGSIYLDKKLFAQSIMLFQKALKAEDAQSENLFLVYNGLGYAYFAQEQYDLAIRNYKEALKLNPEYVICFNNLGHAYERKKLTAQALQAYEDALKYDPNNPTAKRRAESLRKRLVTSA